MAVRTDGAEHTAAETHALLHAAEGFSLELLVDEYWAWTSVLHLWGDGGPTGPALVQGIARFDEAINQALADFNAAVRGGHRGPG
ncbi:hypothetical protein [Aquincola tertiaricarbonis]|uniref:hypothetical protein n=1 Tax=Aquincola tertiaricarbonis TaxID=391953 RepID=UPI0012EE8C8F|nr:hypothetical protein [Aquincola tertiaricarbonis]